MNITSNWQQISAYIYGSMLIGTLCANLSCRLIVSQMSNTRCELINILLYPLTLAVTICLFTPGGGLPSTSELTVLYLLAVSFTGFHVHYGICVVSEMSTHLRIDPLRIKNHGDVRLISSKNDSSANIPIRMFYKQLFG